MSTNHFEGNSVPEHLKAARLKGAMASHEHHGRELSGAFASGIDSAKETSVLLVILFTLFSPSWQVLLTLFSAWLCWKMGRSALLGWARLERLHRLISEERYEVQHHREQEREELTEMYAAKGFSGQQLTDVVDVLMADDNRLLTVMLEEELGLPLESYDHPLRQAFGAGLGVTLSFIGAWFHPLISGGVILTGASLWAAKREKNDGTKALIWNLALGLLTYGVAYFVHQLLI